MSRRESVIVVGAGGSGLPLATRLAQAGHPVTLIDAGPDPVAVEDAALSEALRDARTVSAGLPDGPVAWSYSAELFPGRPWRIARGRLLGGSTAVNGAYFQRPARADFARWEEEAGPEWGYAACLPALRRLESDRDFPDSPLHGGAGPVPVERGDPAEPITAAFLEAAVAAGATLRPDKNDGEAHGVGLLPRNARGAQRWGTWRSYGPLLAEQSGVRLRTRAHVRRILLEDGVAVGVEVETADGMRERVEADEIVLCAGAVETPRLLFASGIGDPEGLRKRGAEVRVPAPDVGGGLADHAAVDVLWHAVPGAVSDDPPAAWTAVGNGGTDAGLAVEHLLAVLPTARILGAPAHPDAPLALRVSLGSPLSRGRLELGEEVVLHYDHLSNPRDEVALLEGVRAAAALLGSAGMASVVAESETPPTDPEAAHAWLRERLGTSLHSCGTARMGRGATGVADSHGRVRGVAGLRIADASLLPSPPSRGTSLTAVLIGERIAELMSDEAGSAG